MIASWGCPIKLRLWFGCDLQVEPNKTCWLWHLLTVAMWLLGIWKSSKLMWRGSTTICGDNAKLLGNKPKMGDSRIMCPLKYDQIY